MYASQAESTATALAAWTPASAEICGIEKLATVAGDFGEEGIEPVPDSLTPDGLNRVRQWEIQRIGGARDVGVARGIHRHGECLILYRTGNQRSPENRARGVELRGESILINCSVPVKPT